MATIEEFNQTIKTLQNMQEGAKIERFKLTATEQMALDFAIDFMKRMLAEENIK